MKKKPNPVKPKLQTRKGVLKKGVKYKGGIHENLASGRVPFELEPSKPPKPPKLQKRAMTYGGTRNSKPSTIYKNKVGK